MIHSRFLVLLCASYTRATSPPMIFCEHDFTSGRFDELIKQYFLSNFGQYGINYLASVGCVGPSINGIEDSGLKSAVETEVNHFVARYSGSTGTIFKLKAREVDEPRFRVHRLVALLNLIKKGGTIPATQVNYIDEVRNKEDRHRQDDAIGKIAEFHKKRSTQGMIVDALKLVELFALSPYGDTRKALGLARDTLATQSRLCSTTEFTVDRLVEKYACRYIPSFLQGEPDIAQVEDLLNRIHSFFLPYKGERGEFGKVGSNLRSQWKHLLDDKNGALRMVQFNCNKGESDQGKSQNMQLFKTITGLVEQIIADIVRSLFTPNDVSYLKNGEIPDGNQYCAIGEGSSDTRAGTLARVNHELCFFMSDRCEGRRDMQDMREGLQKIVDSLAK